MKKILEEGVQKSGRKDKDYIRIIDLKYQHKFLDMFLNVGALDEALSCYRKLEEENDVTEDEYVRYLKTWHPFKYKKYRLAKMPAHAVRRIKKYLHTRG